MQPKISKDLMLALAIFLLALTAWGIWGSWGKSFLGDASAPHNPSLTAVVGNLEQAQTPPTETRAQWIKRTVVRFFYNPFERLFKNIIFTIPFWGVLVLTLVLERWIPAEKDRKIFSAGFRQDIVWFFYEPFLNAFVVGTYVAVLTKLHSVYFPQWTCYGLTQMPVWLRIAVGILVVDLGYWIQHRINHAVPFLWKLHALHHSQTELNFFSDFRYHPLEYLVRHTFVTVPFIFLRIDLPVIVAMVIFKDWYSRFYHGNIRTNLGPLRFVLVTPQSHRVHHSVEREHHDRNFGAIFSIWDHLFGTQCKNYHTYPATGVPGEKLVGLELGDVKNRLKSPWSQMWRRLFGHYK